MAINSSMKKLLLLLLLYLGLIDSVIAEHICPTGLLIPSLEVRSETQVDARVIDSVISFKHDGSKYELPICIGEVTHKSAEANNCKKSSIQPTSDTIIKAHVFDIFSALEPWVSFTEIPISPYKILSCCEKNALAEEVLETLKSLGFHKTYSSRSCFHKKFEWDKIGDIDNHITQYEKELGTQGRCQVYSKTVMEMEEWGFKGGNYKYSCLKFEYEGKVCNVKYSKSKLDFSENLFCYEKSDYDVLREIILDDGFPTEWGGDDF